MVEKVIIPQYALFGETEHFPDVVHCEHFSARAPIHGWRISAHRHAHLAQVFLVNSGQIKASVDGQTLVLEAGHFLFVPANTVHKFIFQPDTEGSVISVPVSIIPAVPELRTGLSQIITGPTQVDLSGLADLLATALTGATPFRIQRAVGLVHSLLGLIAETTTRDHSRSPRLLDLDQLIARNMSQGWGASDYAAALAISPGHLSRLCRTATGKGSAAYIERAVMEEACRLLAFSQLPVSEIGYRLGFSDPSYFSKRFHRAHATPPSGYRARLVS